MVSWQRLFLAIKTPITTPKMITRTTITATNPTTIPTITSTETDDPVVGGAPVEYVSPLSFQLQVKDYSKYMQGYEVLCMQLHAHNFITV